FAFRPSDFGFESPLPSLVRPPQQNRPDRLEQKIGYPNNKIRNEFRPAFQGLAQQDKTVVNPNQNQRHRNSNIGLASMDSDAQRNPHKSETKTRKRKTHLPMNLKHHRRDHVFALLAPKIRSLL